MSVICLKLTKIRDVQKKSSIITHSLHGAQEARCHGDSLCLGPHTAGYGGPMADAKLRTPMANAAASCLPVPVEKNIVFFCDLGWGQTDIKFLELGL